MYFRNDNINKQGGNDIFSLEKNLLDFYFLRISTIVELFGNLILA